MRDLIKIARRFHQYKNYATKDIDLTGKHCKFIMFICNNRGFTQDEIAVSMGVDKSNAARQLCDMEKMGYIERITKEEDKRNLEIYPTEKALTIYPYIKNILMNWDKYVMEDLTDREKEEFFQIITKIKAKADTWQEHDFDLPEFPKELTK